MNFCIKKNQHLRSFLVLMVFTLLIISVQFVWPKTIVKGELFMWDIYMSEVKSELSKCVYSEDVFTKEDISGLPEPVQRYFEYCGYLGKKKMANAKIVFEDVDFVRGLDGKPLKLRSEQYNFVSLPTRIVYLRSNLFGVIPFEGRDKYQNGQGAMTGKLLKVFTLFNAKGPEMDQSGLVTFLAEVLMVPGCALQDYVRWEEIDSNHAKASINYNGIKVEGIFSFNEKGEFIKFTTEDRYMDKGNGVFEKEKWSTEVSNYVVKNGVKVPSRVKGIWNLADGDFVYFDGKVKEIIYNVKKQTF